MTNSPRRAWIALREFREGAASQTDFANDPYIQQDFHQTLETFESRLRDAYQARSAQAVRTELERAVVAGRRAVQDLYIHGVQFSQSRPVVADLNDHLTEIITSVDYLRRRAAKPRPPS